MSPRLIFLLVSGLWPPSVLMPDWRSVDYSYKVFWQGTCIQAQLSIISARSSSALAMKVVIALTASLVHQT